MASQERVQRVAQGIHHCLAQLFIREVKDPRTQTITITDVKLSRDLAHAVVYVAIPGDQKAIDDCLKALEKATGFLRKRVGEELTLRITPSLKFFYDPAVQAGDRIDQLLRNLD